MNIKEPNNPELIYKVLCIINAGTVENLALSLYESSRKKMNGTLSQSDSWIDLDKKDREIFRKKAANLIKEIE